MPLYEYHCSKCGKTFEALQKFSDAPITVHEDCGGAVEKLLSAPAFHLKGSGWYATDYAKSSGGSKPVESKSDSGGETKSDSKPAAAETKSESKTESKSESKPAATTTKSD